MPRDLPIIGAAAAWASAAEIDVMRAIRTAHDRNAAP
jgi:hypothetical protein